MILQLELLQRIAPNDRVAAKILELYSRFSAACRPEKLALSITRVTDTLWRVSDTKKSIHVFTPYRALNFSRSIDWRAQNLAAAYGYGEFYTLKPGDVVVDIGANIGEFSMFGLDQGCTVHAFEPDLEVFQVLQQNVTTHAQAASAQCNHLAVAETTGEKTFWIRSLDADSSLIQPDDATHYAQVSMPTIRLDDYVSKHGITRIELLKCDAEGAEPEVIMGCEGVLPIIRTIAIDCSPERNGKPTHAEVTAFLTARGFTLLTDPQTCGRGMVIARNTQLA